MSGKSVLSLDISSKTGFALFEQCDSKPVLKEFGTLSPDDHRHLQELPYPRSYLEYTRAISSDIAALVKKFNPDEVIIEETNKGKNRYTQKMLEFIHFSFLDLVANTKPCYYISSSTWRSKIGLRMQAEDRAHNRMVKQKKARGLITKKHLAVRWANSHWGLSLKMKDNDAADAICMASAYFLKCAVADGK